MRLACVSADGRTSYDYGSRDIEATNSGEAIHRSARTTFSMLDAVSLGSLEIVVQPPPQTIRCADMGCGRPRLPVDGRWIT